MVDVERQVKKKTALGIGGPGLCDELFDKGGARTVPAASDAAMGVELVLTRGVSIEMVGAFGA